MPGIGIGIGAAQQDRHVRDLALSARMVAPPAVMAGTMRLWTPLDISSIAGLYIAAAANVTKDGSDLVSQLSNLVTGAHHAVQATGSKQPTYIASAINGKPALRFDGARVLDIDTWFLGGTPGVQETRPMSIFTVHKASSVSGGHAIVNLGNAAGGIGATFNIAATGKREIFVVNVSAEEWGDDSTNTEAWLITNESDGAGGGTQKAYLSGVLQTLSANNASPFSSNEAHIGAWRSTAQFGFTGDIAVIGVCTAPLTTNDRSCLAGWTLVNYGV